MKIAIIGSRNFTNYKLLQEILEQYQPKITLVVSGAAKGADSLGEKWALENNIQTLIFPADWNQYGKRAGFIRNEDIIKNCDCCVAFWDGESKGTKNMIETSTKLGLKVLIHKY